LTRKKNASTTKMHTLSLHDALPIYPERQGRPREPEEAGPGVRRRLRATARSGTVMSTESALSYGKPPRDYRLPDATRLGRVVLRSEEHTSELQSRSDLVCRLLLEKK